MKKKTLALFATLLLGASTSLVAQNREVNFTASPTAGYTVWSKSTTLGQSPFWGGRVGFSVGSVLELTGTYQRSFNLKGKLEDIKNDWVTKNLADPLAKMTTDVEMFGGEMRLNLLPTAFMTPFVKAGTGLMNLKYKSGENEYKEEQLYAVLGAGLKFNFNRRFAFSLEGEDLLFKEQKGSAFVKAGYDGKSYFNNWGGRASLSIFLGGRDYENDKFSTALQNLYSDGFKGFKFVAEPGLAYIDFNENSLMRDQWLAGGAAGFDFNSFLGVRGFYYQGTYAPNKLWSGDKEKIFTKALRMYGGHVMARLNAPRGVTPYVTLGAGYLDVDPNNFYDKNNQNKTVESGLFAVAGAGLEVPLGQYVAIFANANAMCNAEKTANNTNPSKVRFNLMYKAGVRFNVGAKSSSSKELYDDYAAGLLESQRMASMNQINELRAAKNRELEAKAKELEAKAKELEDLKSSFEGKIEKLNKKLAKALKNKDYKAVRKLQAEKKNLQSSMNKVDEQIVTNTEAERVVTETIVKEQATPVVITAPVQQPVAQPVVAPQTQTPVIIQAPQATPAVNSNLKVMTTSQLENMITRVLIQSGVNETKNTEAVSGMTDLDKILLFSALSNGSLQLSPAMGAQLGLPVSAPVEGKKLSKDDALNNKIAELEKSLEAKRKELKVKQLEAKLKELNGEEATETKEVKVAVDEESAVAPEVVVEAPVEAVEETVVEEAVVEEAVVETPAEEVVAEAAVEPTEEATIVEEDVLAEEVAEPSTPFIHFEGLDIAVGAEFSKETAKNVFKKFDAKQLIGVVEVMPIWEFGYTGIWIAPELTYTYSHAAHGAEAFANLMYNANFISDSFSPFVGAGYGVRTEIVKGEKYNFKENTHPAYKFFGGFNFNVWGGAINLKYATTIQEFNMGSKGFFANNTISLGYTLKF